MTCLKYSFVIVVRVFQEIVFQLQALSDLCPDRSLQLRTAPILWHRDVLSFLDQPNKRCSMHLLVFLKKCQQLAHHQPVPTQPPGFPLLQILQLLGGRINMYLQFLLLHIKLLRILPYSLGTQTAAFPGQLHSYQLLS